MALVPRQSWAHFNLAVVLWDKGDFDEAITEYRRAVELDPQHTSAYYNLGNALASTGEREQATVVFKTYLRLVGSRPEEAKYLSGVKEYLGGKEWAPTLTMQEIKNGRVVRERIVPLRPER